MLWAQWTYLILTSVGVVGFIYDTAKRCAGPVVREQIGAGEAIARTIVYAACWILLILAGAFDQIIGMPA